MSQDQNESPEKQQLKKDLEGEVYKLQPSVTCNRNEHFFKLITGTTAECTKCPVGYFLGPHGRIAEGHIYIEDQFVI